MSPYPCPRCRKPHCVSHRGDHCGKCTQALSHARTSALRSRTTPTPPLNTSIANCWSAPADSPFERAMDRIEKVTGVPRVMWDTQVNHPYMRAVDKYAKYLVDKTAT